MPKYLTYLRIREVRGAIIEADDPALIEDADIPDAVFTRDVYYEGNVEVLHQVADEMRADFTVQEEPDGTDE